MKIKCKGGYEMKKIFKLVLTGILAISLLVGCGKNTGTDTKTESSSGEFDTSKDIVVVTREEGSGTRGAFIELFGIEEKSPDGKKVDRTTKEAITQMKTDTVIKTVEGNEYSIGYISTGSLNETIKPVKIDGVEPTTDNIKDGSYKIARPFNIAIKDSTDELTKDFMDFIMSKEGQEIVSESYIAIDDNTTPYNGTKPSGKIVVAGSSSVTPVMEKLREGYLKINEDAEIEIQLSDSSAGMQAAIDGTAQIGMASRALKNSEKIELKDIAIALDGIAVIVNKSNSITDLTAENVKSIFIGDTIKWNEIN